MPRGSIRLREHLPRVCRVTIGTNEGRKVEWIGWPRRQIRALFVKLPTVLILSYESISCLVYRTRTARLSEARNDEFSALETV